MSLTIKSKYSGIHTIQGVKSTWLQDVGFCPVKPIEKFRKGDKIAYNYGYTATFISKKEKSPKFWNVTTKDDNSGKLHHTAVKKGTMKPHSKTKGKVR